MELTWGEFKKRVEALGVLDDTLVAFIDIDAVDRREDDPHELRALTTPYPGIAIMDDRADRRTFPGAGESLKL